MNEKHLTQTIQENPMGISSEVEEPLSLEKGEISINFVLNKAKLTKVVAQILFVVFFLLGNQSINSQTVFPRDAQNLHPFDTTDFINDMTKLPTLFNVGPFYDKQSGLVYVFPPDGPGFNPKAPNNDFFKWAAQMFLWTTSTVSDNLDKLPPNPKPPSSRTPYVFNSEFFYKYSDGTLTPQSADGAGAAYFTLRSLKPKDTDGVGQAGGNGVLLSQSDNKASRKTSLVYYGVHTNRVLGYVAAANLKASNTYTQFPSDSSSVCEAIKYGLDNGYAETTEISRYLYSLFCSQHPLPVPLGNDNGLSLPDLETAIDYLSMVVELKTSWVESSSLKNKNKYILQNANVPTYSKTGSVWENTGVKNKELALVGMHVVGTVNGHPEMIWATIEHINNAPNADYYYIDSNGNTVKHSTVYNKPGSSGNNSNWLFANGTNSSQNKETAVLCKHNKENICSHKGAAIAPTNVVRTNPWGVKHSDKKGPKISSELISLNNNVFGALKSYNKTRNINNDPRENYFVSGANWGAGGAIPTSFPNKVKGSVFLANTTMETFHQNIGCFACHSARSKPPIPKDMTTSHIFDKIIKVYKHKR